MLNLALNGGIFSSIWNGIVSIVKFVTNIIDIFKGFFTAVVVYIMAVFYYLFMGICSMVNFAEMLFKKLAGIDPIMTADGEMNILDVFVKSNEIWGLFVSILILSIVLLFLFTIIAVIKSEFSLDAKGSAKGPIIARSLKSLAMFIIVPAVSLMGIYAVNAITDTINSMMKGSDETSMVNQIFYTSAYNANKARRNSKFANYIAGCSADRPNSGFGDFKGSQADIAYKIDMAFKGNLAFKKNVGFQRMELFDDMLDTGDFSTLLMPVEMSVVRSYSVWDIVQVNYYYSLMDIDYIVGIGSAIVITYLLLSMGVVLIKRIFEIVILLLLAAPMISLAPLDGGSASKSWQKEFIKRVIAIVAPVFSINMYFIMIPLFNKITLFGGGIGTIGAISMTNVGAIIGAMATYDALFQLMLICVGMSVVKTAQALLCNLLGIEDLVKSGQEATKKAVGTAVQVAGMVATGGASAAAAVGNIAAKSGAKKAGKTLASSEKDVSAAKDKLAKAEESGDAGRIAAAKKELEDKTKTRDQAKTTFDEKNKAKEHAATLAKDKGEAFFERVAPTAFKGYKDIKETKKHAGMTKADIKAEEEKKTYIAKQEGERLAKEETSNKAEKQRQAGLRYMAQGQTEHHFDSIVATEQQNLSTAQQKISQAQTDHMMANNALQQQLGLDRDSMNNAQKGWQTRRVRAAGQAMEDAERQYHEGSEEAAQASGNISTAKRRKKNAIKAIQSGEVTLDENADGGISIAKDKTQRSAGSTLAKAGLGMFVPGSVATSTAEIVADAVHNERRADGVAAVGEVAEQRNKTGATIAEGEATRDVAAAQKGLLESTNAMETEKDKDHNDQMSEQVEKGLKEAAGDLAKAIKDALQSGKLPIDGIDKLRASMDDLNKQFKTQAKNDTTGQAMIDAIEGLKKQLAELAKASK